MTFPARFEGGMCPAGCGNRIHEGDAVRFTDERQLVHDSCVPKRDPSIMHPCETICPDCWLIRPCRC